MAPARLTFVAFIAFAATGCLGAETNVCESGGVCPPGLVCRLDHGDQVCALASCGNGVREAGESCDDGNNESGDGCPGDCVSMSVCGNTVVEIGEQCDDGNQLSSDGCQANCRLPIYPLARSGHAMAYDESRNTLVMFGGYNSVALGDTWEWNGAEWFERHPSTAPSPRYGAAMVYGQEPGSLLLFGGIAEVMPPQLFDDTWTWDGATWRQLSPSTRPPAGAAMMAFDSRRGVVVLLTRETHQVWEWNGATWMRRFPSSSPPQGAMGETLTFDETRGLTLFVEAGQPILGWDGNSWSMVGGPMPASPPIGQLHYSHWLGSTMYVLEGEAKTYVLGSDNTWIDQAPTTHPNARAGFALADMFGTRVILFGGGSTQELFDDTWIWDGTTWRVQL